MSDDDRAGLAAEYVLGTLDADERDEAVALIDSDPAFAALVTAWERRLSELHAMVDPVTPPAEIWVALRARLPDDPAAALVPPPVPAAAPAIAPVAESAPPPGLASAPTDAIVPAPVTPPALRLPDGPAPDHVGLEPPPAELPPAEPPVGAPPVEVSGAPVEKSPATETPEPEPASDTTPATAEEPSKIPPPEVLLGAALRDELDAGATGAPVSNGTAPDLAVDPEDVIPLAGTGRALVLRPEREEDEAVRRLVRSVQRWRSLAAGLAAFAVALAGITVTTAVAPDLLPDQLRPRPPAEPVREVVRTVEVPGPSPGRFVAVLQAPATTPAFLVTLEPDHKSLMVRRVAPEQEGDKRYELWLVSDRLPAPRSLGLLGTAEFTIVPAIAEFSPEIVESAAYAVSLEEPTGSPVDGPSGPVLASGRLVEAVPAAPAPAP